MLASLYLSFTDYARAHRRRTGSASRTTAKLLRRPPLHQVDLGDADLCRLVGAAGPGLLADHRRRRSTAACAGLAIYRSLFYIPSLIGGSVGIGLLWQQVFGERGVFNDLLALFGIAGAAGSTTQPARCDTVIALHVWTFGASMVIFLAALRQIPESYYEAASIDGANAWQRFRRITLPLLTPVIFFNAVLLTIRSFQGFTQAFVISRGTGGPVDSTLLYTLYLYQRAFQQLRWAMPRPWPGSCWSPSPPSPPSSSGRRASGCSMATARTYDPRRLHGARRSARPSRSCGACGLHAC